MRKRGSYGSGFPNKRYFFRDSATDLRRQRESFKLFSFAYLVFIKAVEFSGPGYLIRRMR